MFPLFIALVLSPLAQATPLADTITLKNGKDIKGLVVEQHADRVIFSTVDGEIPIPLKGIKNIQYDTPEQNFMKVGRSYEQAGRLGEALAYYEKARESNRAFTPAQAAADAVRNRFWAASTEGPRGEIEQKQLLYDAWQRGQDAQQIIRQKGRQDAQALRERLGLTLQKKADWLFVSAIDPKKPAAVAGLKRFDRLTALDSESLRYLSAEVVNRKLLEPRHTNFRLIFARDIYLHRKPRAGAGSLGLAFIIDEYDGLKLRSVKPDSDAEAAGLKEGDLVTSIDGKATRYLALDRVDRIFRGSDQDRIVFTVQRAVLLVRG